MASYYLRGKTYWISYYHKGKLFQYSLKTKDKTVAKFRKNEIENKLARGLHPQPQTNEPTRKIFSEYLEICSHRLSQKTVNDYEHYVGDFLEYMSWPKLQAIELKDFQDYISQQSKSGKSKSTIDHIIRYVVTFFNFAVDRTILEKNVLRKIERERIQNTPPSFISKEQAKNLLDKSKGTRLYAPIATALFAGLRFSELKRLRWNDVDFETNKIMVLRAKSKRFRTIPLHDELKKILLESRNQDEHCFDMINQRTILTALTGGKKKKPLIGWHDLRHTFASHLVMSGVDIRTVSELLGHASIKTTMIYSHLSPEHLKDSLKRLQF